MEFFTKKEIDTFREVAGKDYNPDDPHHKEKIRPVLRGIQEKTNYWADKIVESNPELTYEKQGNYNKLYSHIYKPYAWAKVYKKTDKGKGIFFTVGVETDAYGFMYKLDHQFDKSSPLSEEQKKQFKSFIDSLDISYYSEKVKINPDDIEQYTWKTLIDKTNDFIHEYLPLYSAIIDEIWNQQTDTIANENNAFTFNPDSTPNNSNDTTGTPTTYTQEAKLVEVKHLHNIISSALYDDLSKKFGDKHVSRENDTGFGTRVDIVVELENTYTFYEIKTYIPIKCSIREAIGQLLEYSYWPNRNNAKELVIVTPKLSESKSENGITYIKHLRETLHIPIYIIYYDIENKTFSEKY